ncbi:uncharacterized protein I206_100194 [Kwoniella pini CBS 10737]|uniref:Protein SQS1 n=1 Tax=Kwoniella pini CBS 10737 TaxID=1296096 RepID=A0A1B9IEG6_9TREE|nr:uncharacterized protein I206_01131 [Kwoniella pini CBS 10737]OCF53824.1 hypothetical protein I206_01131 [Kwoniella pini CBS 10737]
MVQRQPFGDFLNSGSPSTPRGRGRGGFRGGGGRGGTPQSGKKSFNADYSNMGFDYDKINSQKYTKMEGFNVQPFGPTTSTSVPSTPHARGNQTPRGRGRGLYQSNRGSNRNPDTPSGAATPVHGLGFHDEKPDPRGKGNHRGLGSGKSTVGQGLGTDTVTWGGRGKAPLFVKAGELFKEGEADVITMDEDNKLHVEAYPMSNPSAPQMTNLQDETEIDIVDQPSPLTVSSASPSASEQELIITAAGGDVLLDEETYLDDTLEELLGTGRSIAGVDELPDQGSMFQADSIAIVETAEAAEIFEESTHGDVNIQEQVFQTAETAAPEAQDVTEMIQLDEIGHTSDGCEVPLFFVDTDPDTNGFSSAPTYQTVGSLPLGQQTPIVSDSNEEQILFKPKTYKKPEPIFVNIGSSSPPKKKTSAPDPPPTRGFVNPRALSRSEKKAAKREKRRGRGKKSHMKKQAKAPREDSDIEWGSDGPPVNILDVEGGESVLELDEDEDIKLLRDYMQGTMLNAKTEQAEREAELGQATMVEDRSDDEDEDAEEVDIEAMKRFGQGIKGLTEGGQEIVEDDEDEWASSDELPDEMNGQTEDDEETSDGSSVLGEIDIEGMMVDSDDEDDEDIDALFAGKANQWHNDQDWFINAMEDALDGSNVNMRDRKSRNALFKSIENGDFGDSWGLTPAPSKKAQKKNKNKFVPEELHAQWEKDRLVKAEKKQQRELERLIAEIEPTLAGYSRKGNAKAKGKGKAHQAAVAHLIPASASQVADLFDVSSDEDELPLPLFRKGGRVPSSMTLEMIDERIQIFLEERSKTTLSLPPMGKDDRKKVHMLADCYSLGSKSRGSGKTRFTILTKNKRSGTLIDEIKIERLLSASQKVGGSFYKALHTRGSSGRTAKPKGGGDRGTSVRHKEGDMVGHGADKIGQENVGHRLLSMMGWSEGDRIGRGAGLEAPIVAIVKNTKTGLGA